MFDFQFRHFITPRVVGVLYALQIIGLTLGIIYYVVEAFKTTSSTTGLLYLVGGIVGWFVGVIIIRVINETIVALTRIAENTTELVDIFGNRSGSMSLQ